jgi:pantoate kinase
VCDTDGLGNRLSDPARIGARGGGFAIARGVTSRVTVRKRERVRIEIRINSKPAPNAHTTRSALEQLIQRAGIGVEVLVDIKVRVPIAAGFGTSAAGTLAACLSFVDASNLSLTFNDVGKITHVAEVLNGTGLGTASALLCSGFVLVREPGAPGIGLVDRLRFPHDHSIVCAYLGPIETRRALNQEDPSKTAGRAAFDAIDRSPSLITFLDESRKFGHQAGFETPAVTRIISTMMSAGAIGAAQNMVGQAVHAVAEDSRVQKIVRAVRAAFPMGKVFASPIDRQGVRLLKENAKH